MSLCYRLVSTIVLCGLLNTAAAYQLLGSKWSAEQMKFDYDLILNGNSRSPSGLSWNQRFADAANEWNRLIDFTMETDDSDPSHPCAGVGSFPDDGFRNGAAFHHELCFQGQNSHVEDFGDRVLAVTITYTFTSKPNEIIEADMFFNTAEGWDLYDGALKNPFDFTRVAMHELGHVLGLDHEEVEKALMQPIVGDIYTLQPDDIAGAVALYGASNDQLTPIVMAIEEPFNGAVQSGISTFRGWVVSLYELTSLKLYLNDNYKGELDHNGPRSDICNVYPDYPDCDKSGFAFAFAFGLLSKDSPSVYRLVATDKLDNTLTKTVSFNVARFDDPFVADPTKVSVAGASVSINDLEEIVIDDMLHNGKRYKAYLKWKPQSQSFEFTNIKTNGFGGNSSPDMSAGGEREPVHLLSYPGS